MMVLPIFNDNMGNSMGQIVTLSETKVPTIRLDTYVEVQKIPMPDYMKVDVEGAEMLVLQGSRNILIKARPTIFLATHGRELHQECCAFLGELGYKLLPLTGASIHTTDEILAYGQ